MAAACHSQYEGWRLQTGTVHGCCLCLLCPLNLAQLVIVPLGLFELIQFVVGPLEFNVVWEADLLLSVLLSVSIKVQM